jgi:hypothetical protein
MSAEDLIAGVLGKMEEHGVRAARAMCADCPPEAGGSQQESEEMSQQREKFLFGQSRKFRFDGAWRNAKRSCGCRHRIGTG